MTQTKVAKRHICTWDSGSRPMLFECMDGSHCVVKYQNNRQGLRVLVNDYLGTKLVRRLGLSCEEQAFVDIPQDLVDIENLTVPNTNEKVKTGRSFGCPFIEGDDHPTGFHWTNLDNPEIAAGMIVFDTWTLNTDRATNLGNVMVKPVPDKQSRFTLVPVDQGHCFGGPRWTAEQLAAREDDLQVRGNHPSVVTAAGGIERFTPFLETLENLSREDLTSMVDQVPNEWGLEGEERKAIVDFLYVRRKKVRDVVVQDLGLVEGNGGVQ